MYYTNHTPLVLYNLGTMQKALRIGGICLRRALCGTWIRVIIIHRHSRSTCIARCLTCQGDLHPSESELTQSIRTTLVMAKMRMPASSWCLYKWDTLGPGVPLTRN